MRPHERVRRCLKGGSLSLEGSHERVTIVIVLPYNVFLTISGTQEQCKQALNHLERVIKVKAKVLSPESKYRRKPKWDLQIPWVKNFRCWKCRKWYHVTTLFNLAQSKGSMKSKIFEKKKSSLLCRGWNLEVTLLTCVRWLLRQCGRPQTECRHVCMELVFKLVPCVDGEIVFHILVFVRC